MNWWNDSLTELAVSSLFSAIVSFIVAKYSVKNNLSEHKVKCLCERVEAIQAEAEAYWGIKGNDSSKERFITSQLHTLNADVIELNRSKAKRNNIEEKLRLFRMQATGGQFGSVKKQEEPGRIKHIQECATELRQSIKLCREYYF